MANRLDIKSLTIKNEHIFEAVNVAREVLGEQVDHLEIKIEGIVRKHIEEVNHRQESKLKMLENKVDRMTHLLERNMKTETRTRNLSDPSTRQFHLKPIEFEDLDEPCTGKEVLGSGGFGTVYKGKLNGRTVAVKMLKKDQNAENDELINELLTMHCYPSEDILQLLTYCSSPQCLVFQYMENGSLNQKLRDTVDPLSWEDRAKIACGIARGLRHLHANSIVHGDIKSSNILLDKYLQPKIGDFGTVKLLYNALGKETSKWTLDVVNGSKYYLPVWYLSGIYRHQVRKPVDVYSFGIVLLEIMSGKLPSDKDANKWTLQDFVINQIDKVPVPPEEYIADVDHDNMEFNIQTVNGPRRLIWPNFFYDMAVLCTTKEFMEMPTMKQLHHELDCVYSHCTESEHISEQRTYSSNLRTYEAMTDSKIKMNIQ